jgi:hypothetical protein
MLIAGRTETRESVGPSNQLGKARVPPAPERSSAS